MILLGMALVGVSPPAASAQRPRAPYRIGVLNDARTANHPAVDGLKAGLRHVGLEEGRDLVFDVRLTDGTSPGMSAAAAALVGAGVDLIFTSTDAATIAARAATSNTPIVFTLVGDPVAVGLVDSLAHPGRNVTGVSSLTPQLIAKRLEALKTLSPGLRRVWIIGYGSDPASTAATSVASRFGLEVVSRSVRTPDDLQRALGEVVPGDALMAPDLATLDISAVLLEASVARRIPAVFSAEIWVNHGGLVSYGPDYRAQGAQAARLVAKILRGARPADLPVESADPVVFAVNLKTAEALGLAVPRQILFRADVIRR
jgi:putative ABC transport system substrate-binding protein